MNDKLHESASKQRCGARTRKGPPCLAPARPNGKCRIHGGLSTGPKTARGWARTRAGYYAWRDGQREAQGS